MADPDGDPSAEDSGTLSVRAGVARPYMVTLLGSSGALLFNLYTGIVSARLLAPEGRGVVGAIVGWVMVTTFLSGFGFQQGLSWIESRDHRRAPAILTTTVISTFALSIMGITIAEILLPIGFGAQTDEALRYARIAMVWVLPYMAYNSFGNVFGARQQFGAVNVLRIAQPILYAVALTLLWIVGQVGVAEVLAVQALSFLIPALVAFAILRRASGMGRPDRSLTREGASFGFRAYGSTLGQLANTRLDLVVLPAVVVAADIGLYVVAVSAATLVVGLFGSLQVVVFPAAARAGGAAAVQLAQRAIRIVMLASIAVASVLGLGASWFVQVLYGAEFIGAVRPLRIMLPGVCCWATAAIVAASLKAIGRPMGATIAQLVGVVVTLVGLAVLLPRYGIAGAALTSTLSYATAFGLGMYLFINATGTTITGTFGLAAIRSDVAWFQERLGRRSARRAR